MIRNLIIILQASIIVLGILWAGNYTNRMDQLFYSNHLRIMAKDIRLLTELKTHIASGKSVEAQNVISETVPSIVAEMEDIIDKQIDPKMQDTFADAKEAGSSLDTIGIHQVSSAIKRRANKEARNIEWFHRLDSYFNSEIPSSFATLVSFAVSIFFLLFFPIPVAWFVGRKSAVRTSSSWSFLTACILLPYGVTALAFMFLYFLTNFADATIAPQLSAAGHPLLANMIFAVNDWLPFASLIVFVSLAFVVPFKLRHSWAAIDAAYRANNSFKPTAGVGLVY